jgi:hypothetical protein
MIRAFLTVSIFNATKISFLFWELRGLSPKFPHSIYILAIYIFP